MAIHLAKLYSAELEGINAKLIEVEIDINVGLHAFSIVGLADKALNEAKERVNSALKNAGVKPPNRENRKIIVNLAPADVKKNGSHYDLAIALGYLLATEQMGGFAVEDKIFIGELALDGRLRPVNGSLSIAQMAADLGFSHVFLPKQNADEAAAITDMKIIPLETLRDAIEFLELRKHIAPTTREAPAVVIMAHRARAKESFPDFSEVVGQENAKRALTIAAAGGHNLLMTGPPGVGKSLLARSLAGILPELAPSEAIEITKIWSAAGLNLARGLMRTRPFRAPHQTASLAALVGGGQDARPGEISLAHRGVLFLDELPEFQKNALEALRQPMESGAVHIARAKQSLVFPAKFTLVAAMNPCPCGYYGDEKQACTCSAYEIMKYQKRISGPLLDRIDMQIKVGRIKIEELRKGTHADLASPAIKRTVEDARKIQAERFSKEWMGIMANSEMTSRETEERVALDPGAERFFDALERSAISPRGYYRILKVARTIADIEKEECVSLEHLAEAFGYRIREEA